MKKVAGMGRKAQILLVEDNPADQRLTEEALRGSTHPIAMSVVSDGVEALDYLNKKGKYKEVTVPDLVILDLNLPRLDGREVLAKIRNHPDTKRIPVVIFTSSMANDDVLACYDLSANSYVHKPADLDGFFSAIQSIEQYWLKTNVLP